VTRPDKLTPRPLDVDWRGEDDAWHRATPERRTAAILWVAQCRESQREVRAEEDRRNKARRTFHAAIRYGKLKRGDTCERCGLKSNNPREIHGHHHDYDKPLDVEWLCRTCHHKHHATLRVGWRAER
jgi:hypothetical protein